MFMCSKFPGSEEPVLTTALACLGTLLGPAEICQERIGSWDTDGIPASPTDPQVSSGNKGSREIPKTLLTKQPTNQQMKT